MAATGTGIGHCSATFTLGRRAGPSSRRSQNLAYSESPGVLAKKNRLLGIPPPQGSDSIGLSEA